MAEVEGGRHWGEVWGDTQQVAVAVFGDMPVEGDTPVWGDTLAEGGIQQGVVVVDTLLAVAGSNWDLELEGVDSFLLDNCERTLALLEGEQTWEEVERTIQCCEGEGPLG